MFSKNNRKAFTLVELIVVIVILAILATIAFLSFSSQSASARDSTRLSDMSNIAKGLSVFNATAGSYPLPDNPITISASGITIGKQGYAGSSVLGMIKISNGGKDPLDNSTYYTYSVNAAQNKFQILGFLEDGSSSALSLVPFKPGLEPGLERVSADLASYSGRYVITKGDGIGILLSSASFVPVQTANSPIDIVKTNSGTTFKAIFGSENSGNNVIASGTGLASNIINKRTDLISNQNLASLDESLISYWDMNTLNGDKMKDLSKYGNDGTISGTLVTSGKIGNARSFAGTGNYLSGLPTILSGDFTYSLWLNTNNPFTTTNPQAIICQRNTTGGNPLIETQINTTGKVNMQLRGNNADGYISITSNTVLNANTWYNLTYIKSGNSIKIYLNGVFELAGTYTGGAWNNANTTYLGRDPYDGIRWFNGMFDEVRIYNRALSDSEISNLYNATK